MERKNNNENEKRNFSRIQQQKAKALKHGISFATVVYHEEEKIRECLESIKDIADEIIVIHDGPCHDKTMKIAAEYTSKLIITPQRFGFCEPHNHLKYELSSYDWFFKIDADIRLTKPLRENIRKLIEIAPDDVDAYGFNWNYYISKDSVKPQFKDSVNLLYRTDRVSHNGICYSGFKFKNKEKETGLEVRHIVGPNYFSIKTFREKFIPRIKADAQHRIKTGYNKLPAPLYLFKACLYFVISICYQLTEKRKGNNIKALLTFACYQFFLYYYLFVYKTIKKKC